MRLRTIIGTIALFASCFISLAQVQDIEHKFSAFTAVSASNGFDVTLSQSDRHKVVLSVDKALADYVKVEVKSRTLVLDLDWKAVPKELKKQYGGRNGLTPTLKAKVYLQSLEGIDLKDNAKLSSLSVFEGGHIIITTTNNAVVRDLDIKGASIKVAADKKSSSTLKLEADDIEINAGGSSSLSVSLTSKILTVNSKGSSSTSIIGDTSDLVVNGDNSSSVKISGKAGTVTVRGLKSADMDLVNVETATADVSLSGSCTLTESASENLKVDIAGGSKLYFSGQPVIEIVKVKASTLMQYSDMPSK